MMRIHAHSVHHVPQERHRFPIRRGCSEYGIVLVHLDGALCEVQSGLEEQARRCPWWSS